mmetsp:Transcript_30819/g.86379  ORF Transcript_30819/g.86379 Transcript_30819/m.86379 type:complete len:678 (-) Transcript_30819:297-2330(-)
MTWDIGLVFRSLDPTAYELVVTQIRQSGFVIVCDGAVKNDGDDRVWLALAVPEDVLNSAAEATAVKKAIIENPCHESLRGTLGGGVKFLRSYEHSTPRELRYEGYTEGAFWTPAERSQLALFHLQSVKSSEYLRAAVPGASRNEYLYDTLRQRQLELVFPPEKTSRNRIWRQSLTAAGPPLAEMRAVYGEAVAFYFAWMSFYMYALLVPAVLGVLLFSLRPEGVTVDDAPYLPFFGMIVVVWGALFIKGWKRRQAELAAEWGSASLPEWHQRPRLEFHGTVRTSYATGSEEVHYPMWKRRSFYLLSFSVTIFFLGFAAVGMVLSLNLQGYMTDPGSPLHIPSFARRAEPGALFDPDGWLFLVPVVAHSTFIMALNTVYRGVAEVLTRWENHRTENEHDQSLILKRFVFEALDCYISLFYLAFVRCDVVLLRAELMGLYLTDQVRRVLLESVVPWVTGKLSSSLAARHRPPFVVVRRPRSRSLDDDGARAVLEEIRKESEKEPYDTFDDMLEMAIQYGYVTMFATAFPLASGLSVLCNVIERSSDLFKLTNVTRRPVSARQGGIGIWLSLLEVQMWFAVFTNCVILGFASDQLASWLPSHFLVLDDNAVLAAGKGRFVVGIVAVLEHVLILVVVTILYTINDTPKWVERHQQRRAFEDEQGLRRLHQAEVETILSKRE